MKGRWPLPPRVRRWGGAAIGFAGTAALVVAIFLLLAGGSPTLRQTGVVTGIVLYYALWAALCGWFLLPHLGTRPGWLGIAQDIGLSLLSILLVAVVSNFWLGEAIMIVPTILVVLVMTPAGLAVTVIGLLVLIAYARLTTPDTDAPTGS